MSTTLTYGRKKPSDGDKGSSWFDDLENNIDIDDAHSHDGVTSTAIPAQNIGKGTSAIANASWVAVSGQQGTYSQTISLPSGVTMLNMIPKFQINNGADLGDLIHPTIRQISVTSYEIFINDNSLDVLATYG